MLTPEQEKWVNSLSDKIVTVIPYDPQSEGIFKKIEREVKDTLGENVEVEHVGASSLGISGQDEIDVSIIATAESFDEYIPLLEKEFGAVQSRYPDRARFTTRVDGKRIDLKIIDKNHPNYIDGENFINYLRESPADLERYRVLKEECSGKSTKEYYRRKIEFINEIKSKIDSLLR